MQNRSESRRIAMTCLYQMDILKQNHLQYDVEEILKENGLEEKSFNRVKNKIYGRLITSYNSPAQIGRIFMRDYMNDIISFDYINEWNNITIEEANEMIKDKFIEEKMILSIVNPK